jgi:hypothetical protein
MVFCEKHCGQNQAKRCVGLQGASVTVMRNGLAVLAAATCWLALGTSIATGASEPRHDDDREIESLAINMDKTIQACGVHAARFNRNGDINILPQRGIELTDNGPEEIKRLASPSTFGRSRFHHWFDPHAQIWLIASSEKPSCRVAVSHSEWIGRIGEKLDSLVQVGNVWRPAKDGESPLQTTEKNGLSSKVYVVDTPENVSVRPTLMILTDSAGTQLPGAQQMIITVVMMSKT